MLILLLAILGLVTAVAAVTIRVFLDRHERLQGQLEDLHHELRELRRTLTPPAGSQPAQPSPPPAPPPPAVEPSRVRAPTPAVPVATAVPPAVSPAPPPAPAVSDLGIPSAPGVPAPPPPSPLPSPPPLPCPAAPAGRPPGPPPPAVPSRPRPHRLWNLIRFGSETLPEGVSVESAMASHWLMILGVIILVLGLGFFLKYSIEHGLIGEQGRAVLSILAGCAMVAGGLRLTGRRYHLMGLGFIGGGLAVLYWSVYALTMYYRLLPQAWALPLVVLVTVAAGVLAVRLDSPLVATIGIVGGYASPMLLIMRQADYLGVFAYLLVLGAGVLAIALWRRWPLLNYLGMLFTYGIFTWVLIRHYEPAHFARVMPFLCGFFALHAAVMYGHNIARRQRTTLVEILGQLLNAGLFFGFGYHLVTGAHPREWAAALTLGLAAFYSLHVSLLLVRRLHDRGLLLTLTALAAFFLTLTMPIALSKEWLTLSWAALAFFLLWLGRRVDSRFLRLLAYALYVITLGRVLVFDLDREFGLWRRAGEAPALRDYGRLLAGRLLVFGAPILSLFGAWWLHRRPTAAGRLAVGRDNDTPGVPMPVALAVFFWAAVLALFGYLNFECDRFFTVAGDPARLPMLTVLWVGLCALVAWRYAVRRHSALLAVLVLLVLAVLAKLWYFDLPSWNLNMADGFVGFYRRWSPADAGLRLLDAGVVLLLLWGVARWLRSGGEEGRFLRGAFGVAGLAVLFLFLTFEVNTFLMLFQRGFRPGGVSILWTLFALFFLVHGLRRDAPAWRYAGLALLAVVVAKVFLFDLAELSSVFRIVAFIVLGLLVISGAYLYLRFRQAGPAASTPPAPPRPPP